MERYRKAFCVLCEYLERAKYTPIDADDFETRWNTWSRDGEFSRALDVRAVSDNARAIYVHFCQPIVAYRLRYLETMLNNFENDRVLERDDLVIFVFELNYTHKMDRLKMQMNFPQHLSHLVSFFDYQELQERLQDHAFNPIDYRIYSEREAIAALAEHASVRNIYHEVGPLWYLDAWARTVFLRPNDFVFVQTTDTNSLTTWHMRRVARPNNIQARAGEQVLTLRPLDARQESVLENTPDA